MHTLILRTDLHGLVNQALQRERAGLEQTYLRESSGINSKSREGGWRVEHIMEKKSAVEAGECGRVVCR